MLRLIDPSIFFLLFFFLTHLPVLFPRRWGKLLLHDLDLYGLSTLPANRGVLHDIELVFPLPGIGTIKHELLNGIRSHKGHLLEVLLEDIFIEGVKSSSLSFKGFSHFPLDFIGESCHFLVH